MKKIYFLASAFFYLCLISGCSKDVLRSYEHRIEGAWRLTDIDRNGIGGGAQNLPFKDGIFTFSGNGELDYVNNASDTFKGSWDIQREWVRGSCSTNEDGNRQCDDRNARSLRITSVNFQTQDVRTEYFNEIVFTNTNRFKAFIHNGLHSYVFRFVRQ